MAENYWLGYALESLERNDKRVTGFRFDCSDRPSMGKTAFAMNIVEDAAIGDHKDGGGVLAGKWRNRPYWRERCAHVRMSIPTECKRARSGGRTRRRS